MSYFGFLVCFLGIPIVGLLGFLAWRRRRLSRTTAESKTRAVWVAVAVQVALAVIYTTPWDNYLVAQRVWYYSPAQVSGVLLGFVPLEEYTFFVLEAILVGLLWQLLGPGMSAADQFRPHSRLRAWCCSLGLVFWISSLVLLFSGWKPGTYLALILAWALPPILIQLGFGADILWGQRRLLTALIFIPALYLSLTDSLAIRDGIWAIDPAQSTGVFISGLPLEEALFFLVTVMLLAFGMTLSLSPQSQARLASFRRSLPLHYAFRARESSEN